MTLGEYLKWSLRQPWGWGAQPGLDCCKFAARWCVERGHPDPMDFLKPLYDSERAALLTIERGGGLLKLWQRGMTEAGVPEADDARAGDIGLLALPQEAGPNQACGIFTGDRWAVLAMAGMLFLGTQDVPDVLAVWRP